MRITVNQASIRIDADNGLQEMEAYGSAPEPSVPLRSSHANLSYLLDRYPDATWIDPGSRLLEVRAARIVAEQDRPKPGEYERKWPFKMACLPFQLEVFAAARHMPVFALAPVAMGTGKTKMTLDIAADKFMRGEIDNVIVIAPNGVNRQWINTAIPMHLSAAVKVAAAVWKVNLKEPLPPKVTTPLAGVLRIASFNVEAFSTESGKAFLAARAFMASGRCMLVMDESSRIKSFRAIRTKVIDKLRQYSVVRCNLSGTPITKGLEDLYSQYNLLDPSIIGMSSFWTFRGRYCHLAAIPGAPSNAMKIVGYRNVEEFVTKIAPVTFVIPKGVLGLPEKTYERREVEMSADQKRLYKALKDEMVSDLRANRIQTPANAAVRLLRLQQLLSGHVVTMDENVVNGEEVRILSSMPVESNRLSVLYDALQEHDGPAVIWARFTADITDIENHLIAKGHKVVTYYGETSTKDRETAVRRFRDGEVDYFIANPDAAGTGLDGLQVAQLAVYYSNSFRAESRWQSEDRIHRLGMAGSAHFIDLVVPNSTDTLVLKNLTEKGNVAKAVFDNPSLLEGTDN